jgi:hypothetical protein
LAFTTRLWRYAACLRYYPQRESLRSKSNVPARLGFRACNGKHQPQTLVAIAVIVQRWIRWKVLSRWLNMVRVRSTQISATVDRDRTLMSTWLACSLPLWLDEQYPAGHCRRDRREARCGVEVPSLSGKHRLDRGLLSWRAPFRPSR